jgi:N-dimethylarginine dimethylaminohydrolase
MKPKLLLSDPSTVSAREPNNPWMTGATFDMSLAWEQWEKLYEELAKEAVIYLLPRGGNFQDRPYVANVGAIVGDTAIISNFKSDPRKGEERVAGMFFTEMGYKVCRPPSCWEGAADLIHLRDNIYFGGHGIRSDAASFVWMENALKINVQPIPMTDPKLYHLDCSILVLPNGKALAQPEVFPPNDNVLVVPERYRYDSWTNSVILGRKWFYYTTDDGDHKSRAALERIAQVEGYEPVYINLSEFEKSGAALSCMVLRL